MDNCQSLLEKNNQIFQNIKGTVVHTTIVTSTTGDKEAFWGVELKIPTSIINHNGEVITFTTPDSACNIMKEYLKEISQPFPLLIDKLSYLNIHFDGNYHNWSDAITSQIINPKNKIYLCDHNHH